MLGRLHTRGLLGMNAGLLIWSAYFVVLYGLMALGCRFGLASTYLLGFNALSVLLAVVVVATTVFIAYLTWLAYAIWQKAQEASIRFRAKVAFLVDLISLVATIWVGLSVFIVAPCI